MNLDFQIRVHVSKLSSHVFMNPANELLGQTLTELSRSIERVDSVDESLRRLDQLHLLLKMGGSDDIPDQSTFMPSVTFVENCFVNAFGSQAASSESKNFLQVMLHYRFNLNACGRWFIQSRPYWISLNPFPKQRDILISDEPLRPPSSMLQAAAWWGDEDSVHILLKNGADPNTGNEEQGTALHAAAWKGHLPIVRALLNAGANPVSNSARFGTCFRAAVLQGHDSVIQTLTELGGDRVHAIKKEESQIAMAIDRGDPAAVNKWLCRGADVNCTVYEMASSTLVRSYSLLQKASLLGSPDVVAILLDRGADVNAEGGKFGFGTVMIAAASRGHSLIIQILLQFGADINAVDQRHGTALIAACERGDLENVRLLLEVGADVNIDTGVRGTAYTAASRLNKEAIVRMLEEAGARRTAESELSGLHTDNRQGDL